MIKNVVFDMGGVLVDVCRDRAIDNFRAIGVDNADELIDPYHHKGIFLDIESGDIDADEFCRLLCRETGKEIAMADIGRAWKSMINPPETYKLDYLLELRKRCRTFVLSNNNPILIDGWARTTDFSPAGRPITDYFDKTYFSYEMKCVKPGDEIFRKMITDSQIIPSETLFLDDSVNNIEAGKRAGFLTYLVQNGEDWRLTLDNIILNINF